MKFSIINLLIIVIFAYSKYRQSLNIKDNYTKLSVKDK